MTPEEIRERWPSLSPRERDALVAEALGYRLYKSPGDFQLVSKAPPLWPEVPWITFDGAKRVGHLKEYTADWKHAGPLLDEMLAAGCEVALYPGGESQIFAGREPFVKLGQKTAPTITATGDSWPERIALAFVLWKGGVR